MTLLKNKIISSTTKKSTKIPKVPSKIPKKQSNNRKTKIYGGIFQYDISNNIPLNTSLKQKYIIDPIYLNPLDPLPNNIIDESLKEQIRRNFNIFFSNLIIKESKRKRSSHFNLIPIKSPPDNITYEELVKVFKNELLYYESIKLDDKAITIANEIAKILKEEEGDKSDLNLYKFKTIKRIFNNIIESKITEVETNFNEIKYNEMLRTKLWNIFYTANFGYNSQLKIIGGVKSKSRGITKHSKTSLKQNFVTISSRFIFPWKNLFINVYKRLWYFFKLTEDNDESYFFDNYTVKSFNEKRIELRNTIINSYDANDREKIKAEFEIFDILDPKSDLIWDINQSIWSRFLMEWRIKEYEKYPYPEKREQQHKFMKKYTIKTYSSSYIYLPFKYFPIYAIQIHNKFSREHLLEQFFYLVKNMKDLTTFVDLQDCESTGEVTGTKRGCYPYDRSAMPEMFHLAVKILTDLDLIDNHQRNYLSIPYFEDMKAGSIYSWNELSNIPPLLNNAHICVHYSSAKGGTGIVLLFLRLREARKKSEISLVTDEYKRYLNLITEEDVISSLEKIHFGNGNIFNLIKKFKSLFKDLVLDSNYFLNRYEESKRLGRSENNDDLVYLKIKEDEDAFNDLVENDIFNTKFIWHVKLLRQRLNRIFYFLAKQHNIKSFYLYSSLDIDNNSIQPVNNKPATDKDIIQLFSAPLKVSINWEMINSETLDLHQKWIDGIIN
jgi:hypothetical protein